MMANLLNGLISFICTSNNWSEDLFEDLRVYLIVIFLLIGSVAACYGVYLGYLLATSQDQDKRSQAKSRVLRTVVGVFIIVILATLMYSDKFVEGITGNKKIAIPEWRYELVGAKYCKLDSVWRWEGGTKEIKLHRRDPHEKGGFNEDAEKDFATSGGPNGTVGAIRLQIISREPVGANVTISDTGRVDEMQNKDGATINTRNMGATGTGLIVRSDCILQISIEFFDVERGSFQIAVRMIVVRVSLYDGLCTHTRCEVTE